eukprot:GAHX01000621.1.p1 GENE.GAHX01000621.1~~GAHX01000621.1.p1  ORF type:complete len:199 (+),score=20.65 GAHX01000621.1:37-633(+)
MYDDLEPRNSKTTTPTPRTSVTSQDITMDTSYDTPKKNSIPLLSFLQSNGIQTPVMIWKLLILLLDILTIILLASLKRWLTWVLLLPILLFFFVIDLDSYDFLYWVNSKVEDFVHFKSLLNIEFEFVGIISIISMMILSLMIGGWNKCVFWLAFAWTFELAGIKFGSNVGAGNLTRFDKTDVHTMQNNEGETDIVGKL